MRKTKWPVELWTDPKGEWYAFPMGATDKDGNDVAPNFDPAGWKHHGPLPAGIEVEDVKEAGGKRVTCRMGHTLVYTSKWAITAAPGSATADVF